MMFKHWRMIVLVALVCALSYEAYTQPNTPTCNQFGIAPAACTQSQMLSMLGLNQPLIATSTTIGGTLLLAGGCQSTNVTVAGATSGMAVVVTPASDPGNSVQWQGFTSTNNVTVRICALLAATPASVTYNIRVIP